jgi:2-iminobutanoate/2-iminopropanoate deaminase
VLKDEPIERQTEPALDNLVAVLETGGADVEDILKVTIFLGDIDNFEAMNETYAGYFDDEPPARSAIEVAALPKGVGIEVEAIASLE